MIGLTGDADCTVTVTTTRCRPCVCGGGDGPVGWHWRRHARRRAGNEWTHEHAGASVPILCAPSAWERTHTNGAGDGAAR